MLLQKLMDVRKQLLINKEVPSDEELQQGYQLFQDKFGPDSLKVLDGMELLETLFHVGNRESLVYWIEFKNDEEFRTVTYGSIAGGSSYKFILFKRSSDKTWITGSGQKPIELNEDEALELGKSIRDNLVLGAEIIMNVIGKQDKLDKDNYIELQEQFNEKLTHNMSNLGWVHKYFHLIFPELIDDFHNMEWQKNAVIKLQQKPVSPEGLYSLAGQLMLLAKEANMPVNHFTHAINVHYGAPHPYWRIGTTTGDKSYWEEMYSEGYISIGWPALGDLSRFDNMKRTEIKEQIKPLLQENYNVTPQVIGKWATQIATFLTNVKKGAIIVAADGERVLGLGKVIGTYEYLKDKDFPHTIKTEWLKTPNSKLPQSKEGLQTTLYQLRDLDNVLEIEKWLTEEGVATAPPPAKLASLTGTMAKVEGILQRKRQVILYGPPGTGKTYYAEKTCYELSARQLFKKGYEQLNDGEKQELSNRKTVRMCTFHPSYGYEDFIEGIKPSVVNHNTLFQLKDGIFKSICEEAKKHPADNYYLIIDEINRGDISRIFGELITIIETNKRGKEVILPLSNDVFSVPANVFIIGTMNTADRSIALLDIALRRRFGFIELLPDYQLFHGHSIENLPLGEWLKGLNQRIITHLGQDARNLQIGHSYFLEKERPVTNPEKFARIVEEDVIPLIEEYCYGDYGKIADILGTGLVNLKTKTMNDELFHESSIDSLVTALLEPTPDLITLSPQEEEDEIEDEETDVKLESMTDKDD